MFSVLTEWGVTWVYSREFAGTGYGTYGQSNTTIVYMKLTLRIGSRMVDSMLTPYNDVIMAAMASQIISLTIVCSIVYSGAYQRKHQSSAPLTFVWGIHRWQVNSPHKWPATRKMLPYDEVHHVFCPRIMAARRPTHASHCVALDTSI